MPESPPHSAAGLFGPMPSAAAAPGRDPRRRGRGATPVYERHVRIAQPNPAGRYELTFRYRPLQRWPRERLHEAEALLVEYFARFGGFRLADDWLVRVWVEALADFTPDEVRAAMDAKFKSLVGATPDESRAKRAAFTATPQAFVLRLGYWYERSEHCARQRAQREEAARRERIEEIAAARWRAERSGRAPRGSAAPSAASQAEREAAADAYFDSLSDSQRRAAVDATRGTFETLARNYGWLRDPSRDCEGAVPDGVGALADRLRRDIAIAWARRQWPARPEGRGGSRV